MAAVAPAQSSVGRFPPLRLQSLNENTDSPLFQRRRLHAEESDNMLLDISSISNGSDG